MKLYDVIIAGAGPAGLTAAIYLKRAGRSVLLLEKNNIGGQINDSPLVENYPAVPDVSGAALAAGMAEQAEALGAVIESCEVTGAHSAPDGFTVNTDTGDYSCKKLIIATGVTHRSLGLKDEEDLIGAGISFCAVCDGAFYKGRDVAVVGGGDTALGDAVYLSDICRTVYLIHRRDEFRAAKAMVDRVKSRGNIELVLSHTPEEYLTADGEIRGLRVKDLKTGESKDIAVDGIFLAVGNIPENAPFASLVDLDKNGYIIAGEDTVTSCPGVFAAGDCRTKNIRQLTTATADGTVAAMEAGS